MLVIALLAVYSLIGVDYLKQHRHNVALAGQIAADKALLTLIPSPPADLAQRLSATQAGLNDAEAAFTADTNDTQIVNTILRLAEEIGVKAIPLNTSPWVTEKVADRDYSVFRVNLDLNGSYDQILSFTDRLENGEPATLVIEYLFAERVTDPATTNGTDTAAMPFNANMKIAVYALLPAAN
jgi:hypothetical protein